MSGVLAVAKGSKKRSWAQEDNQRSKWIKMPWVPWGIERNFLNLYPHKIEVLFTRSSILHRVCTDNAAAILGTGLVFEGSESKLAAELFEGAGIDQNFLSRCANDIALFNGFCVQVAVVNDGERGIMPARVRHQKIARVRVERPDETGEVKAYYISTDWAGIDPFTGAVKIGWQEDIGSGIDPISGMPAIPLPSVQPRRIIGYGVKAREKLSLYYDYLYSPVTDYYPMPDSESCYEALATNIDIIEYQRRYVQNNMSLGGILQVPYTPTQTNPGQPLTEEDKRRIEKDKAQFTEALTGAMNAGKTVVAFNDQRRAPGQTEVPEIKFLQPIEERNDKKFLEVQSQCDQSAMTGLLVVAKELYGLSSNSGFTSQSEHLITAADLTDKKVIAPKRSILVKFLNRMAKDMGLDVKVSLKPAAPVTFQLSPEMVTAGIITVDEYRKSIGLEPLDAVKQGDQANTEQSAKPKPTPTP